jgi:hypothetical protein
MTARMISRFRPPVDIIGLTTSRKVWYKLALSWGVIPVMSGMFSSTDVLFYHATETAKKVFGLESGDHIIITGDTSTAFPATRADQDRNDLICRGAVKKENASAAFSFCLSGSRCLFISRCGAARLLPSAPDNRRAEF